MTLSLEWLNDYLKTELTPGQIADALTSIGLEVEKISSYDSIMGGLHGVIAGKVLSCEKHPDADRLSITTVDVGQEKPSSIVCGANNIEKGQTVWVALPGTTLYDASGAPREIKISKIRGCLSEGMICAEDELGLGKDHEGIMVLPDAVHAGTKASDYYKVSSDTLFEIGLTPNRSDATSMLGVAEDLAACLSVQQNKEYKVLWPACHEIKSTGSSAQFKVTVKDPTACPRYSGVVISNLRIAESPDWLKKRLQSIGVKTINNVVDITNFVLHEMGQPLHAFDADKITGNEIIVETLESGTPFLALDGEEYLLYHEDLMICDGEHSPMCIGGVYGGLNSGVTAGTTRIFLESAHFNAGNIRRTSMRHNLRTEAARRFEKGSDPNVTVKALTRAADLLSTLAGGVVTSEVYDVYPQPIHPSIVSLHFAHLNAITGVTFTSAEVKRILHALNMSYVEEGATGLTVRVPTNKADVTREIDVIEEILRIYGFANVPLPVKMHTSIAYEPRFAAYKIRRLIGHYLSSRGFLEMMNLSLTQPLYYRESNEVNREDWVLIHNTSNESLNLLRPEMVMPALETLRRNINRQQKDLRLFEFGKTYSHENNIPNESEHLFLLISGNQHPDHWSTDSGSKPFDFFSIKGDVMSLLDRLGLKNVVTHEFHHHHGMEYGQVIIAGADPVCRFGKVSSELCSLMDVSADVYVADFDFQLLQRHVSAGVTIFEELNRFPSVERDLAIVIDQQVPFEAIRQAAIRAGGNWLTSIQVFDIYSNPEQLGHGKKSVALRFTIENKEATLGEREIDHWFSKMQKSLASELNATIRK